MKPHETLPNHLFLPGISRAEPHQQRAPSFLRPSPPPQTPSLPNAHPRSARPRCAGRKSNFLADRKARINAAAANRETQVKGMSRRSDHLFFQGDLTATLEGHRSNLLSQVSALSPSQLLSADDAQVCEHFVAEFTVQPVALHEEALELIEPREIEIEEFDHTFGERYRTKKLEFKFELPFSGDKELLKCKPSTFDFNPPRGEVSGNRIVFTWLGTNREGGAVKSAVNEWLNSVKKYISWQNLQITQWNNTLPASVKQLVAARRGKLVGDRQLVDTLGFQVRRRGDQPAAYTFPVQRKKVAPPLPPTKPGALSKPEPALEMAVYEDILETLAGMSVTMERCPSAFVNLDEESLRMQFLIPLNSKFQGTTSGETFNAAGKTDIMIKHGDRILFVAECKFWKGPQSLSETIDQLLGYLTWRETKAAILLFNRNRDFSAVLAQIPGVVETHKQFVRKEGYEKTTGFRFVVRHPNDTARHLFVTILAFDVPTTS